MKCGNIPHEYKDLYKRLVRKGMAPLENKLRGSVNTLEKPAPANAARELLKYKEDLDAANARIRFTEAQLEHPDTLEEGEKNATLSFEKALQDYVQTRLDNEGKLPDIPEAVAAHPDWAPSRFYPVPDFMKNPQNAYERLNAAEAMFKDAAKMRFHTNAQEAGEIGPMRHKGPFVAPEHPFSSLSLHPGHLFGVHQSVKPFYDQVLNHYDGKISKTQRVMRSIISTIMWNPLFHALNISGRFIPQMFSLKGMGKLKGQFQRAIADQQNPEQMSQLARDGFTPYYPHGFEPNDLADTWMKKLHARIKGPLPGLSEYLARWPKMLSTVVNTLGLTYRNMMYDRLISEGATHEEASLQSAHAGTDIAGTIGRDMFKEGVNKWGDFLLFSLRYTSTTFSLGMKAIRTDNVLRKKLEARGIDPGRLESILSRQKKSYQVALMKDYFSNFIFMNGMNYLLTKINNMEDKNGKKGGHFVWDNPGTTWRDTIMPQKINWKTENGNNLTISTPFRTTRDLLEILNLSTAPLDTGRIAENKASPLLHMVLDTYRASKGDFTMPEPGLTAANYGGRMLSDISPVNVQNLLVRSATAMYGKSLQPLFEGIYSSVQPSSLEQFGLMLAGMQTGKGPSAQGQADSYEAYKAKQAVAHFRSNPAIRELLQKRDPATINLFLQEAQKSGMSYKMANLVLRYIMNAPVSTKSGMLYRANQK